MVLWCYDIINQMGHSHHEPCLSSFENTIAIWMVSTISDGDCSREIKRHLLLGRKVMTNLDSILKSRDIANKGLSGQGYSFSSGHVWM